MITAASQIMNEGLHPPIPSEAPEHIQQLLEDCWQLSPSQRPLPEEICDIIQSWNVKSNHLESDVLTNDSREQPDPTSDYQKIPLKSPYLFSPK